MGRSKFVKKKLRALHDVTSWVGNIDKVINRDRSPLINVQFAKVHCVRTLPIGGNVMEKCKQRFIFATTICPLDGFSVLAAKNHAYPAEIIAYISAGYE